MVAHDFLALGLGRFVRSERVIAIEPITGEERGPGNRTLVWVDGLDRPLIAARSEAALLGDLGGSVPRSASPASDGDPPGDPPPEVERPPSLF